MEAVARYPQRVPVVEASQIGVARRAAVATAGTIGFDEPDSSDVAIAVTELATNLVRHAKRGEIILRALDDCGRLGLEILSIDHGPGIIDVGDALRDGFSTRGTQGNGLGAVRRAAATFDLYTSPAGTVILARFWPGEPPPPNAACEVGVVCLPVGNETACGDAWEIVPGDGRTKVLVADGLGHGVHAAEASRQAVQLFRVNVHASPEAIIQTLHAGLRGTRGAAVAVVELRGGSHELCFAGVGNISGLVLAAPRPRSTVSHNGTVGAELRRVQEFLYPWPDDALLILHSDGLTSQWNLSAYPGLPARHPSLIAGVLYRDFRRERDDVTVLVIRAKAAAK